MWNRHHRRRMRLERARARRVKWCSWSGEQKFGSEWRSLVLSAFAREGACRLELQTNGQRKGGTALAQGPSVRGKFVCFKVRGTKGLEFVSGIEQGKKYARGCAPEYRGRFRIERGG